MCAWRTFKSLAISSVLISGFANAASKTHQDADLAQFLQNFHQNTAEVMQQLPVKDISANANMPFQNADNAVTAKDEARQQMIQLAGRAGIRSSDRTENLVDSGIDHIKNLNKMDQKGLQKASLTIKPWSDDYWAIAKGVLGARYEDPNAKKTFDWNDNQNYVLENPVSAYLTEGLQDYLSPSEKYDLLVGDKDFSLTKAMWEEGKPYYDRDGKVETWMGICHGWAPAAYMLDRPQKAIKVKAADGETELTFFPSDIKSLASLLWAKASTPSKFVGGRCNEKDPERDSENGRVIDQKCFDTNPGTWHKSVVNQIAIADRSFVMDATFDYEVWNQPVYSYSYRYFNVESFESANTFEAAKIEMKDFKKDKFKKYRGGKAVYVVGVEMNVSYIAETQPTHRTFDNDSYDLESRVTYRYDLEVDAEGNIVGGEWYSNKHPDFLWTPPVGTKAKSWVEAQYPQYISDYDTDGVVGEKLQYVAPYASKSGQPLAEILEKLIEKTRR
ncbi:MAG: hypothetical protein KC493_17955 [Bacteriovoracaceae bacterium]|nr:hypothetical protein [Bacteriovoracaceae bacterium]